MSEIQKALSRLFDENRIVFWYDTGRELRKEYEAVDLSGVEKIELSNNEFGVKHRLLREEPGQKFLLYHEGPRPADEENWLLDLLLGHEEFRTDQVGVWLTELGLRIEHAPLVEEHKEFFKTAKRREAFKKKRPESQKTSAVRLAMLAVCAASEPRVEAVLETLLEEHAGNKSEKLGLVERCGLSGCFWEFLATCFGYKSETPSLQDFLLELFRSCYQMETEGEPSLTNNAMVFLSRWRDNRHHVKTYREISREVAGLLDMEQELVNREYRSLLSVDHFDMVDMKILSEMAEEIRGRTLSLEACQSIVQQRMRCHWQDTFGAHYKALYFAADFFNTLQSIDISMESLADGLSRYTTSWHRVDALYRKFYRHYRSVNQITLLRPLAEEIESRYVNDFLLPLNSRWQERVDAAPAWQAGCMLRQDGFYERMVRPYIDAGKKIFVIVSDALRFEIGMELQHQILKEDRYGVTCEPMLSMLPSYTQLGMAALLPNKRLELQHDAHASVRVDGESASGTEGRSRILDAALPGKATAIQASDFLTMSRDQSRELVKQHQLIYLYQNHIDFVGDKRDSEERLIEAVQETLEELVVVVKKLANANASNILITADHGFLFQQGELEESDLSQAEPDGQSIFHRDRRFVSGKGLKPQAGLLSRTAEELGLSGEIELQFAKSVSRLKRKGSGMRFVHGGASLQEVVVPVLHVSKKRTSDVSVVEVDILQGASQVITSGQLGVTFYQTGPVTEKVQPRTLRAGIYSASGDLISQVKELVFDLGNENARERESTVSFVLSTKADQFNNQDVTLKLEELIPATTKYRHYKSANYVLRKAFQTDFDF
ncbi:hypothetical protein DSLASN_30560 [Desulfoluna limicola]|uniref:PglZ domain-containing protein n=1 Tax=Desulfoluna limicola TaxID=2810562 RepID=A0ABM7PJT4_9BACT|nr:BREX-1 system phosphatase PglZ type A [Desulfoluna limicola]BCS97424.1 hypothetical protein DSLASN_30560 [Desulfoluna limicola]